MSADPVMPATKSGRGTGFRAGAQAREHGARWFRCQQLETGQRVAAVVPLG